MHTTYSLSSSSIDAIPKSLSLLRRRLIRVEEFSSNTKEGIFHFTITIDIPEGHEERFMRLFEKIYEIEVVKWTHRDNHSGTQIFL